MKLFNIDDYYFIVAKDAEEAKRHYIEETLDNYSELDIIEVKDLNSMSMVFPINELPDQYHNKEKYPIINWHGYYEGVRIPYGEAIKYKKAKPPYILAVSSEVM